MKRIDLPGFLADAERLVCGAASDDDFLAIDTDAGSAVLISEAEWKVLVDALRLCVEAPLKS
jgi:PHD/YefM family antitoxin component YafN of YafNO toxin-antitoxin module